jgi:two-component system nitrogen regulation response regulator NtrX
MERILVVDDDHETRVVLEEILRRSGFAVSVAMGGSEAVRCWRTERIDLAVVDIWMPEKDGLETITEIRRISPNAKIIAISGVRTAGPMDPLALASRLGVRQTLQKPFTGEQLLYAISDLLHPAHSDTSLATKS